jgi:hypothetical protein
MINPSTKGPRSLTVHEAVAPDELLMVTTVPIGNVLCAHVPGGAASYHEAPPLWLRPDGAVVDPDEGLGAGLAGAVVGLGDVFTVVVVRRTTVVDVEGAVARTRATVDGGAVATTVVGGSVGTGASERLTRLSTGRGADVAASDTSSRDTWTGDDAGGGDACISANAGPPAMAAQRATGTARRAFAKPRVVRTPPLWKTPGPSASPLVEAQPGDVSVHGEVTRAFLWIATSGKTDS